MSELPVIRVVAAELMRDGRWLITQRQPTASLPLLWEFPGGRVEDGESDEDALRRELEYRVGVEITDVSPSMQVTHDYARYRLQMTTFHARLAEGHEPWPLKVHAVKWVTLEELALHPFPGADQQTVDALLGGPQ